ncbi:MAG: FAD-dependent oxidoreductase [Gammaproteobacteria bacterium]|nr:FAD-dependent oxidoreductase [Gammaproteobacteria bacterium]
MKAEVVIAGAGIAGVSVAYHLSVRHGLQDVVVCDPRPPLTLTSDKSTECYRNWWPGEPMVQLMNRSIDLLEELAAVSGNVFNLNRRGYVYITADDTRLETLESDAAATAKAGGGRLRVHRPLEGRAPCEAARHWDGVTSGADLITDPDLLWRLFPYLTKDAVGALHVRRAGWLSAQQLGAWLLTEARSAGVKFLPHEIVGVQTGPGGVCAVDLDDGNRIETRVFVDAAGPMVSDVAGLLGEELPVHAELHLKVAFKDHLGVVPRDAPLLIWDDPQSIPWDPEEISGLRDGMSDLLDVLPSGCHLRPEGGAESPWVLGLWEVRRRDVTPTFPIPIDPMHAEVVLRGLSKMIPALEVYRGRAPKTIVDGGYYLKTPENLPIVGPLQTHGAFVIGALSGFGIMASQAAAELVSLHITGERLPEYANAFGLQRFDDPSHLDSIGTDNGQL